MNPRTLIATARRDWRRVHQHHGGVAAVARCLTGTAAVRLGHGPQTFQGRVESLTFSVVPHLTRLWLETAQEAWNDGVQRAVVGDCSGGLNLSESPCGTLEVATVPFLNLHHGAKLDTFLRRRCSATYVLVCDDDVLWRDDVPLRWALAELQRDADAVVASLMPRRTVSSVLQGRLEAPMGSDCLLIDRQAWLREDLSFQVVFPAAEEGYDWFYDTGDWAHLEILRRGLRVVVAPPEIRQRLLAFDGVSSWLLRFQDPTPGALHKSLEGIPERQDKAFRTLLLAEAVGTAGAGDLVSRDALVRAGSVLDDLLSEEHKAALRREEEPRLEDLIALLANTCLVEDPTEGPAASPAASPAHSPAGSPAQGAHGET